MVEFLKLEKIEFGGVRGWSLSELVVQMFNDFQELMTQFSSKPKDPLDLTNLVCIIYHEYLTLTLSLKFSGYILCPISGVSQ